MRSGLSVSDYQAGRCDFDRAGTSLPPSLPPMTKASHWGHGRTCEMCLR